LPPPARCAGYYAHEAQIDNAFGWRRRRRGGVVCGSYHPEPS